jgi:polysaccharide biosynthesis transport protein
MSRYDRQILPPARETLEAPRSAPVERHETALDAAWRILRRHLLVVVAAIVLTAAAAYLYSASKDKQYTATASILFRSDTEDLLGTSSSSPLLDPQREAATNEELLSLGVVASSAAQRLGDGVTPDQVASAVKVVSSKESNIVDVEATTTSARLSARMVNAYGAAFIAFRRNSARSQVQEALNLARAAQARLTPTQRAGDRGTQLQDRINQLETTQSLQTGGAELVQPAGVPTTPSAPKPARNGILGGIVGAIVGFMIAALRERRDRTIKSVEDLEAAFGRPVITRIPRSRALARPGWGNLTGEDAEAFRMLRASLRYYVMNGDTPSLLVASAMPGEGKSTVARHLAEMMAIMGDSVVLVEADMHRPAAGRPSRFSEQGLSTVLAGDDLDDSLLEIALESSIHDGRSLTVLPSGPVPLNPSELLEGERMRDVLLELQGRFEVVIVDSPPLPLLSDAMTLVAQASGVIAVSAIGRTTEDGVREFLRVMALHRGDLLGVVANFAPRAMGGAAAHYYQRS